MIAIICALLAGFAIGAILNSYAAAQAIKQIRRRFLTALRDGHRERRELLRDKQALRRELEEWKTRAGLVSSAKIAWRPAKGNQCPCSGFSAEHTSSICSECSHQKTQHFWGSREGCNVTTASIR